MGQTYDNYSKFSWTNSKNEDLRFAVKALFLKMIYTYQL